MGDGSTHSQNRTPHFAEAARMILHVRPWQDHRRLKRPLQGAAWAETWSKPA
jgi:hypothetical protein